MRFGDLTVGDRFTIQQEGFCMRWLLGYVFLKTSAAIAVTEALLPGMPGDVNKCLKREIAFQADFPVVPHRQEAA